MALKVPRSGGDTSLDNKQVRAAILPIGVVDAEVLQVIQRGLCEAFPKTDCEIRVAMPIPEDTYNSTRGQYHSTNILSKISNYTRDFYTNWVLGVIDVDLYVPGLNFVFGEAIYLGRVALVSLFRLKQEFYGLRPDKKLYFERAKKEGIHEIGHTIGLTHCDNHFCVMIFSNNIQMTDRKKPKFCEKCWPKVLRSIDLFTK